MFRPPVLSVCLAFALVPCCISRHFQPKAHTLSPLSAPTASAQAHLTPPTPGQPKRDTTDSRTSNSGPALGNGSARTKRHRFHNPGNQQAHPAIPRAGRFPPVRQIQPTHLSVASERTRQQQWSSHTFAPSDPFYHCCHALFGICPRASRPGRARDWRLGGKYLSGTLSRLCPREPHACVGQLCVGARFAC